METTQPDAEVLIPDQVIDERFNNLFDPSLDDAVPGAGSLTTLTRRQKFAATMVLVVLAVAALGVAAVVAIGSIVVAAVLFVVGVVVRLAAAISARTKR